VGDESLRWNTLLDSLTLMTEKLEALGFAYYGSKVIVVGAENEQEDV